MARRVEAGQVDPLAWPIALIDLMFSPGPRPTTRMAGGNTMKARDLMVSPVVTVKPDTTVRDVARIFLERQISAVPVVDEQGGVV